MNRDLFILKIDFKRCANSPLAPHRAVGGGHANTGRLGSQAQRSCALCAHRAFATGRIGRGFNALVLSTPQKSTCIGQISLGLANGIDGNIVLGCGQVRIDIKCVI